MNKYLKCVASMKSKSAKCINVNIKATYFKKVKCKEKKIRRFQIKCRENSPPGLIVL